MSPRHPSRSVDSARPGVSPSSSKAKSTLGSPHPAGNMRSVATASEQLGVRTPRNVLNTGLLYVGEGEAFIKKHGLGESPLLETRGEESLRILKNIMVFLFALQNKKQPSPTVFPQLRRYINIQIPRLLLMDFFSAQNRLFPESKHYEGRLVPAGVPLTVLFIEARPLFCNQLY